MSEVTLTDNYNEGAMHTGLGRMLLIVETIPQSSGLKRDDGVLRAAYSDEEDYDFIRGNAMISDVCEMAYISGQAFTVFYALNKRVESFSFNFDELLERVRKIEPANAKDQLRKICRDVYNSYEKAKRRLTDYDDIEIYNEKNKIMADYISHIQGKGFSSPCRSFSDKIADAKARRALSSAYGSTPKLSADLK